MLVLFMHFCAAVLCFVMQLFSSSIVGTTHPEFCDDKIICWARRELVHHTLTAILCWHAISFPLRDQTKTAVMLSDWLAILFLRWYVMDAKLCHYSFRGTQSHVNKLCGQSKGRDIIFHLKKKCWRGNLCLQHILQNLCGRERFILWLNTSGQIRIRIQGF